MIKAMTLQFLWEIAAEIRSANFFTMMVDEATNISLLILCIRWLDDSLDCREDFIGLHSLDDADTDTIVAVVKDVILRMNLKLKKCRGQCYDGCPTMKGKKASLAKQIKSEETKALLTHLLHTVIKFSIWW